MKKKRIRGRPAPHIDYHKRAIIPMINRITMEVDFDVIIYGYSISDLCVVPCPPVQRLAERHPNHTSTIFHMKEFPNHETHTNT